MIDNKFLVLPTDCIFVAGTYTQHPTEEEAKRFAALKTHETRESFSVYEINLVSSFRAQTAVLETPTVRQLNGVISEQE